MRLFMLVSAIALSCVAVEIPFEDFATPVSDKNPIHMDTGSYVFSFTTPNSSSVLIRLKMEFYSATGNQDCTGTLSLEGNAFSNNSYCLNDAHKNLTFQISPTTVYQLGNGVTPDVTTVKCVKLTDMKNTLDNNTASVTCSGSTCSLQSGTTIALPSTLTAGAGCTP